MEIGEEIVAHKGKYKYVSRKMRKSLKKYLKHQKKNKEGFWSKERKWWDYDNRRTSRNT